MPLDGKAIKQGRLRRGWSIKQLATMAGVARSHIYFIEKGEIRNPRAGTIAKIALALEQPSPPAVTQRIATAVQKLDEARSVLAPLAPAREAKPRSPIRGRRASPRTAPAGRPVVPNR